MSDCGDHKTLSDWSHMLHGVRHWHCSKCDVCAPWMPGWMYFGNIECLRCGRAAIDEVLCPKHSVGKRETAR